MAWPELLGEGGTLIPLLALAMCVVRRVDRVIELCLRARIESRAEYEDRTTMTAVAAALPQGGAAVRFRSGQPDWVIYKHYAGTGQPALYRGEAA